MFIGAIHLPLVEVGVFLRENDKEYEAGLYYEEDIDGYKLIISAGGISWNGVNVPLDEVIGVAWDRKRQGNGGIMRVSTRLIINTPRFLIELAPKGKQYDDIVQHLWQAVAGPISTKILRLQVRRLFIISVIRQRIEHAYP